MRWVERLARIVIPDPVLPGKDEGSHQLVHRVVDPPVSPLGEGGIREVEDPLQRRIIALADGRSMSEIIDILYGEEVCAGAWAADIGIWKGRFRDDATKVIGEIVRLGYISVEPAGTADNANSRPHAVEGPEDKSFDKPRMSGRKGALERRSNCGLVRK